VMPRETKKFFLRVMLTLYSLRDDEIIVIPARISGSNRAKTRTHLYYLAVYGSYVTLPCEFSLALLHQLFLTRECPRVLRGWSEISRLPPNPGPGLKAKPE
jgi:hypothetical protein